MGQTMATPEPESASLDDSSLRHGWDFITRKDYKLLENGKQIRFASYNIPNLLFLEDRPRPSDTLYGFPICKFPVQNPEYDVNGYAYGKENGKTCIVPKHGESDPLGDKWELPTAWEQEDALLSIKGSGGQVARTYTLGFGPNYHVSGPRQFNEAPFVALDNALALARKHRIRLIIPIVNNHNGGDSTDVGNFGDYLSLCKFRGLKASEFYTNPVLRQDLKDIITYVLNRVNTVNGVAYKDDPTILAWQLGNELGGWDEPAPPAEWSIDIARHIKSIARKTLVMDGTMGGLNAPSRLPIESLRSDAIDIFSVHYYYGQSDLPRIKADTKFVCDKYGKAFIIGEFGFDYNTVRDIYKASLENKYVSGALVWSLRFHSRDGGFFVHEEYNGFFAFHVPGFPTTPGFGVDDSKMATMVRFYAYAMQGLKADRVPFLEPVKPIAIPNVTPDRLTWGGSAWSQSYNVYRRNTNENRFKFITNISDGVSSGKFFLNDTTAQPKQKYYYIIEPLAVNGKPGKDVLELGPLEMK